MEFLFSCSNQYLTCLLLSLMRFQGELTREEKILNYMPPFIIPYIVFILLGCKINLIFNSNPPGNELVLKKE